MAAWYDYGFYYPPSRPREAKGGIKAKSRRGAFGRNWWSRRWIEVLEGFRIGGRLGRGRSYARRGQVLSIDIEKGTVRAKVQGSRPTPYRVTLRVTALSRKDWEKVARILSRQLVFSAKLLAGEMPAEIEEVFEQADLSLFPRKQKDLRTDCSCPDWSNPCKHVAAVYYLLGEEFDRDPFLIFRLRGLRREKLVQLIDRFGGGSPETGPAGEAADADGRRPSAAPEPLPVEVAAFWEGGNTPEPGADVTPPRSPAPLVRQLGGFPFWRGDEPFDEAVAPIYSASSNRAVQIAVPPPAGEDR